MNIYEGMFIFDEVLRDETLDAVIATVTGDMTRYGGEIVTTKVLGRRTFARPMHKRNAGVYVRVVFKLAAGDIDRLLARYRLNDDVFRVQIVRGTEASLELDVPPVEEAETVAEEAATAEA